MKRGAPAGPSARPGPGGGRAPHAGASPPSLTHVVVGLSSFAYSGGPFLCVWNGSRIVRPTSEPTEDVDAHAAQGRGHGNAGINEDPQFRSRERQKEPPTQL